ncbi:MAG: hypothetical protein R6U20_13645 [Longimonas sp.]|uniref:hypothetical protein n=1 Tax=Longimonas sp. TaxID=2039626 RepID=UPI003974BB28
MSRLLNTIGLFLGLWTFTSLVSMFVNGENITFWATGFGIGIAALLVWAPIYLYVKSRQTVGTEEPAPASPLAWLGIIPAAALVLFLLSILQVIVGGGGSTWVNTGIGAFLVAAITAPILIFMRGLRTQRSVSTPDVPTHEATEPFIADSTLPFSLSDLPTAPDADAPDDIGWPYSTDDDDDFSVGPDADSDATEVTTPKKRA